MEDTYESAWATLRRIQKMRLYALAALFIGPFLTVLIMGLLLRFATFQFLLRLGNVPFLIGCAFLFTWGFCEYKLYKWECPRCGKAFGRLHEECQSCALPLWESKAGAESIPMSTPRI